MSQVEYTVRVTLKTFHRIFSPTFEQFEFRFCAEFGENAAQLAASNVRSQGWPYQEVQTQIIAELPIGSVKPTVVKFEQAPLKSCREMEIEQREAEWEAAQV